MLRCARYDRGIGLRACGWSRSGLFEFNSGSLGRCDGVGWCIDCFVFIVRVGFDSPRRIRGWLEAVEAVGAVILVTEEPVTSVLSRVTRVVERIALCLWIVAVCKLRAVEFLSYDDGLRGFVLRYSVSRSSRSSDCCKLSQAHAR